MSLLYHFPKALKATSRVDPQATKKKMSLLGRGIPTELGREVYFTHSVGGETVRSQGR